jgi:hypothetical protein
MARDEDIQLLESVAVRRRRLEGALLHGALASRRQRQELLGRAMAGVVVAALLAGGCVAWSFARHQAAGQARPAGQAPVVGTAPATTPGVGP